MISRPWYVRPSTSSFTSCGLLREVVELVADPSGLVPRAEDRVPARSLLRRQLRLGHPVAVVLHFHVEASAEPVVLSCAEHHIDLDLFPAWAGRHDVEPF